MLGPGQVQSRHGPWHTDRQMPVVVQHAVVLVPAHKHRRKRRRRGRFPKIVGYGFALERPVDQAPPPTEVAGSGLGHRQGKCDRHRGIDGVATIPENPFADLGSETVLRNNHRVTSANRLGAAGE